MTNTWQDAGPLDAVPIGGMLGVDVGERRVLLVREDNTVKALDGKCPHAGAPLDQGRLCDGVITCPWHMGRFRVDDGGLVDAPPLEGLRVYPVRIEHGRVEVGSIANAEPHAESSTSACRKLVIVGGGAAGTAAIVAARATGYDGDIVVIEPHAEEPVDRTQLTKMALAGKKPLDAIDLVPEPRMTDLRIERIAGTVASLDPQAHALTLSDDTTISFDRCILATGALPTKPHFVEHAPDRLFTIRHVDDVARIRTLCGDARSAIIFGTSFIGMEAASALRGAGLAVTIVGRESAPFVTRFGPVVAEAVAGLHTSNGVTLRLGREVKTVERDETGIAVELDDGTKLHADFGVIGYGVRPATDYASALNRDEHGGIVVDQFLRAADNVFAVGDIASVPLSDGGKPVRIEHWRLAEQHGMTAARNALGAAEPFDRVPFFWSQQHGKRLGYVGHAAKPDEIVIDGDAAQMKFIAWYVEQGVVTAALSCGHEDATMVLLDVLRVKPTLEAARNAVNGTEPAVSA